MISQKKRSLPGLFILVSACFALFSFSVDSGGDVFEISLGDKVIVEQFVHRDKSVRTIQLSDADANETLNVRYSHCGVVGSARKLALKDNTRVVKTWNFPDALKGTSPAMSCNVKEILSLSKNAKRLDLVYTSKELPEGKTLATINTTEAKASIR